MDTYVVDTSVVIKWFNQENEPHVELAHKIYTDMVSGKIILIAPSLLEIELVNALKRGKSVPILAIKKNIKNLFSFSCNHKRTNTDNIRTNSRDYGSASNHNL